MKKLHLCFGITAGIMTLVAIVIALVMYVSNIGNTDTSFPAWTAFIIVGIYYLIGLVIWSALWLVAWVILRNRACKKQNNIL